MAKNNTLCNFELYIHFLMCGLWWIISAKRIKNEILGEDNVFIQIANAIESREDWSRQAICMSG